MRLTDYWSARLLLCMYVLTTSLISWADPRTLVSELLVQSGQAGWLVLAALICLSLVGLLDVVINDFMPKPLTLNFVHRYRHLLFMAIAIGSVLVSGVIATSAGWTVMLLKFWLDAAAACALAFLEMFPRHRNPKGAQ